MKLLVAALDSELTAFPAEIPGFLRLVTGPGKLQGAVHLTRTLLAHPVDEIVVVGTAGALDDTLADGVYDVTGALQHDVTDLAGVVGQHVSLPARVRIGAEREGVIIATGDQFVDDADAVRSIRELGAHLVDMETYAYAWVAGEFDTPIRVLKAVSDRAQDGATLEWDDRVAACSAQLWESFRRDYLD